jgi:hypothetical protein
MVNQKLIVLAISMILMQLYGLAFLLFLEREMQNKFVKKMIMRKSRVFKKKLRLKRLREASRRTRSVWCAAGRSDTWWTNMITGKVIEPNEWKDNFRLSRNEFESLHELLAPYITPNPNSPNPIPVNSHKRLALTLYYLKDMGSIRMTANQFGVAKYTASKIIHQVTQAITDKIGPQLLKLPATAQELRQKVSEFEVKFGIKQAFAAIDGTQIPLLRPREDSQDYFCYKQFHAINVQAVCDANGLFMDVDCRLPM